MSNVERSTNDSITKAGKIPYQNTPRRISHCVDKCGRGWSLRKPRFLRTITEPGLPKKTPAPATLVSQCSVKYTVRNRKHSLHGRSSQARDHRIRTDRGRQDRHECLDGS